MKEFDPDNETIDDLYNRVEATAFRGDPVPVDLLSRLMAEGYDISHLT